VTGDAASVAGTLREKDRLDAGFEEFVVERGLGGFGLQATASRPGRVDADRDRCRTHHNRRDEHECIAHRASYALNRRGAAEEA